MSETVMTVEKRSDLTIHLEEVRAGGSEAGDRLVAAI
jgi:hypothetical protein